MLKWAMLKWALIGLAALVVLVLGALLALPLLLDTPAIQTYASQAASHALGRPVKFNALSISALPLPSVKLRGLQVAEDPSFGPGPFITVTEGRMRIRLRPLLQGRVELADLTLEEPRIHVVEDAAGRLNVATLGGGGAPPAPTGPPRVGTGRPGVAAASAVLLSRVRIVKGAIDYQQAGAKSAQFTLDAIDVTVTQAAAGEVLRVSGSAQAQPGNVKLTIAEATVGVAPGRAFGDAQLKATVDIESRDVAPAAALFVPKPTVSGPLKGRIQVSGTAARLTASGAVGFDRLTLSAQQPHCLEPKRRSLTLDDVRVPLLYTPLQLESQSVHGNVAKGTVTFRLTVALGPPRVATLRDITVKGVQLEPVLVDYLCQRNAVTGPLDLTGEATPAPARGSAHPQRRGPAPHRGGPRHRPRSAERPRPGARPDRPGLGHARQRAGWEPAGRGLAAQLRLHHRELHDHQRRGPDRGPGLPGPRPQADRGGNLRARGRPNRGGRDRDPGWQPGEGPGGGWPGGADDRAHRRPDQGDEGPQENARSAVALNRAPPSLPASTSPTKNA